MKRNAYGKKLDSRLAPNGIEYKNVNGAIVRTIDKKELKKLVKEEKLKIKFGEKYDPNYGK